MGRLSGKVAIITGGARSMGAATSRLFVAEGAKVAITDVLEEEGRALAAELGDAARFYRHDVTSEAGWADVVQQAEADLGPVDVLVNNAGGVAAIGPFEDMEQSARDWEIALNINGVVNCTQAVARDMLSRQTGSVINISSN